MSIVNSISKMAEMARIASRQVASASLAVRNGAIRSISQSLVEHKAQILEANHTDLREAGERGIAKPLQDRLHLDERGITRMLDATEAVAALPDPIGKVDGLTEQPSGIAVGRMRIPLGVIGMIYESRPNVTVEAATLCIKSGNACILRGGSESISTNRVIAQCIEEGLRDAGLPKEVVQVLRFTDRGAVSALLSQDEFVDLIVPRGGKGLIERVTQETRIPVLKHLDGICHVYIDQFADLNMAVEIAVNSKTSKYAVCNAMETLLIHEQIADEVIPTLVQRYDDADVEIRGCEQSRAISSTILEASADDWGEEYLGPILSVRVVPSMEEAISHITEFGSGHTDVIVTQHHEHAQRFLAEVDSSTVMVNASSQFADGFEFGLGAEIGISTDKLHARGPVGLEGLTTQKFIVYGHGEVRNR